MITHVFSINIELHKWNSPLKGVVWSNLLHAIALCYKLHSKRGVFTPILWIIDEISFWRTHTIVGLNRNHCFSCDLCENRVCTIDKHWLIVRIRVKKNGSYAFNIRLNHIRFICVGRKSHMEIYANQISLHLSKRQWFVISFIFKLTNYKSRINHFIHIQNNIMLCSIGI